VFSAEENSVANLYWQAADGTGTPQQLTDRPRSQFPTSFTHDGKSLLFSEPVNAPFDMGIVDLAGDRHGAWLIHTSFSETNGEISTDGKWLAYESNESGQQEVWVRSFPDIDRERWQVSTDGGSRPAWSQDGHELFYHIGVQGGVGVKILSVPLQWGASRPFGTPHVIVDGAYLTPNAGRNYDVSNDGMRFLMIKDATPAPSSARPPSQIAVELNWVDGLKRLVPTK